MMRAVALVLVLAMVLIANRAGGEVNRFATMALGFVLLVAALVGEAGERLKLPKVTGYLLVGLLLGPSVLDLVTPSMTRNLRLVNGLAVALISFSAGMELDVAELRKNWRRLTKHGGLIILVVFVGLIVATLAASPWLPFTATEPWPRRVAIALVLGAVMATFSPTVTMAVIAETRARGPLAERALALVVMGDLAVVLLFTLSTTIAKLLEGGGANLGGALGHVTWEVTGSLLVGLLAGLGIYAYRQVVNRRSGLVIGAMCLLLAEVGSRLGLSALLSCLIAGLVVRNLAPDAVSELEKLLEKVQLPVLVVFFAAAGASVGLGELLALWPVVLGLALLRGALIWLGNGPAAHDTGLSEPVARHVPFALVSQAGVTVGLAVLVARDFGAWGRTLEALIVATISLQQLVGPVAFRWALQRMGEIPEGTPEPELTPGPAPAA